MSSKKGRAWVFDDNVDTDLIYHNKYLAESDPKNMPKGEELAKHCMEDIDREFVNKVQPGDIIVAEKNFGCGSSREHAVYCLEYAGVPCVLAETCSRIYYRNAVNNGYPVLFVKGLSDAIHKGEIKDGDMLSVDMENGLIRDETNGKEFRGDAVSDLEKEIMKAGGLFNYVKAHRTEK